MKFNKYDRSILSNNAYCTVTLIIGEKEYEFINAESAYQAIKCEGFEELFLETSAETAITLAKLLPHRPDWEDIKLLAMQTVLEAKFAKDSNYGYLLSKIKGKIKEVNETNDTYWGTCNGKGKNYLGKLLMQVRDNLNSL